jgi:hypothetical protein
MKLKLCWPKNTSVVDLLWGDRSPMVAVLRMVFKVIVALVLGLSLHEGIAALLAPTANDVQLLMAEFADAAKHLEKVKGKYDKLGLCVDAKPRIVGSCPKSQFGMRDTAGLGYQIIGIEPNGEPKVAAEGAIYRVSRIGGLVSHATISESIDTMLRKIEREAFNVGKSGPTLKLCTGTRSLESKENCEVTAQIGTSLVGPRNDANGNSRERTLQRLIERARVVSLFVGLIQFGTISLFFYAMIETFGLWRRWVAPDNTLYEVVAATGASPGTVEGTGIVRPVDGEEPLKALSKTPIRSLGDRLYLVDLRAAADIKESPPATAEEFVAVHSSYRDFLREDAITRQDVLETYGDAMLKLAFLGTVYGIADALFSARGLDTADPIQRLAIKSQMYSGIGVGFGTTLLGIGLSIIAAQFRSVLATSWSERIGTAYQLLLHFGLEGFKAQANMIDPKLIEHTAVEPSGAIAPPRRSAQERRKSQSIVHTLGAVVLGLAVVALLYHWRGTIWSLLQRLLE